MEYLTSYGLVITQTTNRTSRRNRINLVPPTLLDCLSSVEHLGHSHTHSVPKVRLIPPECLQKLKNALTAKWEWPVADQWRQMRAERTDVSASVQGRLFSICSIVATPIASNL